MSSIDIIFNIDEKKAILKIDDITINYDLSLIEFDYTQSASISYSISSDIKWSFEWQIWNKIEQFVSFSEYNSNRDKPWKDHVRWSFISNPQAGTIQNSQVKRMFYYPNPRINEINIKTICNEYGNWDLENCKIGYY